jgi:hypothetical protein
MSENIEENIIQGDSQKKKDEVRKLTRELRKQGKTPEPIIILNDGTIKKASDLNINEQTEEFLKCAKDPIYFIKTYLTIFDQTIGDEGEIVPFNLFSFQEDLINLYLDERFVIANKYRCYISTSGC